jgi:hypothetical protein
MMKHSVLLLAGMVMAAAAADPAECAVDGAAAVSELSDVVVFLWSASVRCGGPPKGNAKSAKCEIDIASAVKATNDMVLVILKAFKKCGAIQSESYACGMAVGKLTSAASGLAAASGGILDACPKPGALPTSTGPFVDSQTNTGKCFIDAKGTVSTLFTAVLQMSKVKKDCEEGSASCLMNALSIITSFSSMGSAVSGAFNDCSLFGGNMTGGAGNSMAKCSSSTLAAISALGNVGVAGTGIAKNCKVSNARLFEVEAAATAEVKESSNKTMVLGLAAFLPIAAVLSFVGGSRFTRIRQEYKAQKVPNFEIDELVNPITSA